MFKIGVYFEKPIGEEPLENSEYRKRKKVLQKVYFHPAVAARSEFLAELYRAKIIDYEIMAKAADLVNWKNQEQKEKYYEALSKLIEEFIH